MATIVTAFVTNINNIEFRSYEKYIELGKKLLSQAIPTVCYLEKHIYEKFFSQELSQYPLTHFRIFERTDNYLYEYEPILTKFRLRTDNPTKDTPGYMFIQCHKTEWVKMAIEDNPFQTEQFVWIDFGIFHMIRDELNFAVTLKDLVRKRHDKVRIASCVSPDSSCPPSITYQVAWFFAGSIFGGHKDTLLRFAAIMKQYVIQFMQENNHIMWEINIWYLLYQQYKNEIFAPYGANHDLSILENY